MPCSNRCTSLADRWTAWLPTAAQNSGFAGEAAHDRPRSSRFLRVQNGRFQLAGVTRIRGAGRGHAAPASLRVRVVFFRSRAMPIRRLPRRRQQHPHIQFNLPKWNHTLNCAVVQRIIPITSAASFVVSRMMFVSLPALACLNERTTLHARTQALVFRAIERALARAVKRVNKLKPEN